MSFQNREMEYQGAGNMFAQITPVVKWLLILNVGLYFLDLIVLDKAIRYTGAFAVRSAIFEGRIWEFISFQFIHGSLGHILFNSVGLFFFGPFMERWWGPKKFLIFYLLSGVGGALFFTILIYLRILPGTEMESALIGASAGIYGILAGVAVVAPAMRVSLLFPPVTLSMKNLALILLGISAGSILLKIGGNEGGEAGHLGGAIAGFLLVRFNGWQHLLNTGFAPNNSPKAPRKDIEPKIRPRTRVDLGSETEVDAILDKISQSGFQSLTDEERETLQQASKNKKK
ncbi:rhomboid family intramembrane serine protease [Luteolibacter sp. AS25]|uniref:rhomboid family intramembrane serine protease n=1 Tax=Luteolibacter sp. AS25 TaxID=3135776 RepID=UPI00398ADCA3